MESRAASLQAVISRLGAALGADREAMHSLREGVMRSLRDADAAVAAYERARLRREANAAAASGAQLAPDVRARLAVTGRSPLPSPVLVEATPALQRRLEDYMRQITELDALLLRRGPPGVSPACAPGGAAEVVRAIIENTHQYMLQVAARVSASHEQVAAARERCQAALRKSGGAGGGGADPFAAAAAAERAEAAAAEAAPQFAASPAPAAAAPMGLPGFASNAAGLTTNAAANTATIAATPATLGVGGLFGTPAPAPAALGGGAPLSPLAPTALNFSIASPAPAPTPSLFGAAAPAAPAAGALFGAAPASPGLFGAWGRTEPRCLLL